MMALLLLCNGSKIRTYFTNAHGVGIWILLYMVDGRLVGVMEDFCE
jgi:hypothetical protein